MVLIDYTRMDKSHADGLRIVHHIVIGVNRNHIPIYKIDDAFEQLKIDLTRFTGGVTAFLADGTWTKNAQQDDYSGKIEQDIAANFIITLTPENNDQLWPVISNTIKETIEDFDLGCQHIHVASWTATSNIFTIKQNGEVDPPTADDWDDCLCPHLDKEAV